MTFPRAFKYLDDPAPPLATDALPPGDQRALRAALRELAASTASASASRWAERPAVDVATDAPVLGTLIDLGEGVTVDVRDHATAQEWRHLRI